MNKYYIWYTTPDGDHSKCWVPAASKQEAIEKAMREYDDIARIDSVIKQ